jgi:hypothetical protein
MSVFSLRAPCEIITAAVPAIRGAAAVYTLADKLQRRLRPERLSTLFGVPDVVFSSWEVLRVLHVIPLKSRTFSKAFKFLCFL